MSGKDYKFLYWDDSDENDEEKEAEKRMQIIMRNGNSGEHYFDYFNNHPSSAEVWDDEEEQDVEWLVKPYMLMYASELFTVHIVARCGNRRVSRARLVSAAWW